MSPITRNEIWLHNKCHKIYLSGPFGIFCLYVILTISYLRPQTIETSSLPTDSSCRGPCSNKSRFFLYWLYDCIFQLYVLSLIYARVSRVPPRDFAFWAKSLRGQLLLFLLIYGSNENRNQLEILSVCRTKQVTGRRSNIANIHFGELVYTGKQL